MIYAENRREIPNCELSLNNETYIELGTFTTYSPLAIPIKRNSPYRWSCPFANSPEFLGSVLLGPPLFGTAVRVKHYAPRTSLKSAAPTPNVQISIKPTQHKARLIRITLPFLNSRPSSRSGRLSVRETGC